MAAEMFPPSAANAARLALITPDCMPASVANIEMTVGGEVISGSSSSDSWSVVKVCSLEMSSSLPLISLEATRKK